MFEPAMGGFIAGVYTPGLNRIVRSLDIIQSANTSPTSAVNCSSSLAFASS